MAPVTLCKIIFIIKLMLIVNSESGYKKTHQIQVHRSGKLYRKNEIRRNGNRREIAPTKKSGIQLHRPLQSTHPISSKNFEKVSIEVQRLFNSFNTKRHGIARVEDSNAANEDEMTVVIENDGDDGSDEELREQRDNVPANIDQSGFTIILDNTDRKNETLVTKDKASDFNKLSHSYDIMSKRFENYLSEEKVHLPTRKNSVPQNAKATKQQVNKSEFPLAPSTTGMPDRRTTITKNNHVTSVMNVNNLNQRLGNHSEIMASAIRDNHESKNGRSSIIKLNESERVEISNEKDKETLNSSDKDYGKNSITENVTNSLIRTGVSKVLKLINDEEKDPAQSNDNWRKQNGGLIVADDDRKTKIETNNMIIGNSKQSMPTMKKIHPTHSEISTKKVNGLTNMSILKEKNRTNDEGNANVDNRTREEYNSTSRKIIDKKIVHPRKAEAMLEYLNKDPLESWIYRFSNLKELGMNSTMLRNGLVNAGSIDRLKNVMHKALKGEDVILSIVGGSISAGGGLYKDEESIDGLYYKGLVDWWNKAITPLTGSEMKVNNIAIGSIGTDYFSFCLKSHISNNTNIIIWELSGNDYNRYLKQPTKGAKPLERLIRMALMLPSSPAILFINFFKGIDFKKSKRNCPNFEDQGEDIVAHYYKIPSLSWRAMVCESLIEHEQLFTLQMLFCKDQNHPSLRAHAQMALLIILHLRHVMRSVLQWASTHNGYLPNFLQFYSIPPPLFLGLEYPTPLCWTLITPDFKESIYNTLDVNVVDQNGFKLEYATNFPIRFDRVICWKAESNDATMKIQFTIPDKSNQACILKECPMQTKAEVAITSHTRFGGAAEVWLDIHPDNPIIIKEGREYDTGKRTQVDLVAKNVEPGVHTLNLKATKQGFCLTSVMVN